MSGIDRALTIADAVMYEGYALYPYRPSAQKNQRRWQIGVAAPPAWAAKDGERARFGARCLLQAPGSSAVRVVLRYLQIVPGRGADEGIERRLDVRPVVDDLLASAVEVRAAIDSGPGDDILLVVGATVVDAARDLVRLDLTVENRSAWDGDDRAEALRRSMVGLHVLLETLDGSFPSLRDPPGWASEAARACRGDGLWPILTGPPGDGSTLLCAPMIIDDHPRIAPESRGDFFDGAEIDELLTLRTLTLTDDEMTAIGGLDVGLRTGPDPSVFKEM